MTEEFGPLRQAMSDLAEHGGTTDMYERSLRKSRQSQRRAAFTTVAAAAAVVFAVSGAVAIATANRPAPLPPVASRPPTPSATPTAAVTSAAPSAAPTSAAPRTAPPSSPARPSSPRTSNRPQYPDCPSAKALEKLADLPKDWYFVPSTVECWKGWARATPDGPDHGDGFYLFRYKAGNGWKYHSQGSAYECQELGIKEESPFCG
jgi:hypothetical protein